MKSPGQRYSSPLRYPGGKAKFAYFIKLLIMENGLVGCTYVEPYAGGASVALGLLFEDWVESVHINDLNPGLFAFWRSVLYRTEALCELVMTAQLTVVEWRRQQAIAFANQADELERGFATFYLNRTNRSGIITGGLIGGIKQSGVWRMDARFPKEELVRRIRKISRFGTRITVSNLDAVELLITESRESARGGQTLYFLDPPYYVKGERLYDNFCEHADHLAVRDAVQELDQPWVVSYDSAPQILSMWDGNRPLPYRAPYSASRRHCGDEVMFFRSGLAVPHGSPESVSGKRVAAARQESVFGAVMRR